MFHIDFESQQTKNYLNFAKYGLITLLVALVTVALVFAAGGYDIDRKTGEIIQNGLVIIASEPVNADVFINGHDEDDPTSSKFSLPSGQYTFELKREGYHDWIKRITIEGSEVIWLQYPRLIPSDIKTSNVQAYKNVDLVSQTPDRKYLFVHEAGKENNFSLLNIESTGSDPEAVVLPPAVLNVTAGVKSTFKVIDWAQDSRSVVVQHKNGSTTEMILFDVTNAENAVNLTQKYELPLTKLRFIDNSRDRLYTLVNKSLRIVDVGASTITAPLIDNVAQYVPKDGIVAALHGKPNEVKVSILDNGTSVYKFTDLNGSIDKYLIDNGVYDGTRNLTIADNAQNRVFIYEDILKTAKAKEGPKLLDSLRLDATKFLSISPNGQFVMVQNGKDVRLYDFDIDKKRAFTAQQDVTEKTEAKWIDGYHLSIIDQKAQANFMDYDGLNSHVLATLDPTLGVMYAPNVEGVFFFTTDSKGSDILKYSSLVVN